MPRLLRIQLLLLPLLLVQLLARGSCCTAPHRMFDCMLQAVGWARWHAWWAAPARAARQWLCFMGACMLIGKVHAAAGGRRRRRPQG